MLILVPEDLRSARVPALPGFRAHSAIDPMHHAIHSQIYASLRRTVRLEVVAAQDTGQIDDRRDAADPAFFELERQRLFPHGWMAVGEQGFTHGPRRPDQTRAA